MGFVTTCLVRRPGRRFFFVTGNSARAVEDVVVSGVNNSIRQVCRPTVIFHDRTTQAFFNGRSYFKGRFPGLNRGATFQFLVCVQRVIIDVFLLCLTAIGATALVAGGDAHPRYCFACVRHCLLWVRRCVLVFIPRPTFRACGRLCKLRFRSYRSPRGHHISSLI